MTRGLIYFCAKWFVKAGVRWGLCFVLLLLIPTFFLPIANVLLGGKLDKGFPSGLFLNDIFRLAREADPTCTPFIYPDSELQESEFFLPIRAEDVEWKEKYDMLAASTAFRRFPLPCPFGLGTYYVKDNELFLQKRYLRFLNDRETRRLGARIEGVSKTSNFRLWESYIPDVILYAVFGIMILLACFRSKRIDKKEQISIARLEKLAALCAEYQSRRGRYPSSLNELDNVAPGELRDAVKGRLFRLVTPNRDELLLTTDKPWRSGAFPFSLEKRSLFTTKDGIVKRVNGRLCCDYFMEQIRQIQSGSEVASSLSPKTLESLTSKSRRCWLSFLIAMPIFFALFVAMNLEAFAPFVTRIQTLDLDYDFCVISGVVVFALWLISLWGNLSLWITGRADYSLKLRLLTAFLSLGSIFILIELPFTLPLFKALWLFFSYPVY